MSSLFRRIHPSMTRAFVENIHARRSCSEHYTSAGRCSGEIRRVTCRPSKNAVFVVSHLMSDDIRMASRERRQWRWHCANWRSFLSRRTEAPMSGAVDGTTGGI